MVNKCLACPTEDGLKQYFVCMHYFIAWLVQNLNSKNILWHSKITRTVCFKKKNNNIMRHQTARMKTFRCSVFLIQQHNFLLLSFLSESHYNVTEKSKPTQRRFKKNISYSLYLPRNILIWFTVLFLFSL